LEFGSKFACLIDKNLDQIHVLRSLIDQILKIKVQTRNMLVKKIKIKISNILK
jgi:hypothetical protein